MPPKKLPESGQSKKAGESGFQKSGSREKESKQFQSDLAMDILAELYPLLLENCTDEDDEIDTQAVFEVLAGMMGLFLVDYQSGYGHEKAMSAMQDMVDLALNLYQERAEEE